MLWIKKKKRSTDFTLQQLVDLYETFGIVTVLNDGKIGKQYQSDED